MRQIVGYFEDLWKSKGLDIAVPSFGHISDLFACIPVEVRHFCDKVAERLRRGESVSLMMESILEIVKNQPILKMEKCS